MSIGGGRDRDKDPRVGDFLQKGGFFVQIAGNQLEIDIEKLIF